MAASWSEQANIVLETKMKEMMEFNKINNREWSYQEDPKEKEKKKLGLKNTWNFRKADKETPKRRWKRGSEKEKKLLPKQAEQAKGEIEKAENAENENSNIPVKKDMQEEIEEYKEAP